ncbi:xanthine dehydrogenase family protein molybdopterin-binding subunit [Salinarimonas chemoclinalis]|uniref:xanthine dehydrogenase family protein molybdopterin-binding subunit n=1 Tax=Salinarimonas chemoclinalis TaxID=3241599 RepID=UPI003558C83A
MGWSRRRVLAALGWSAAGIVAVAAWGGARAGLPPLPHRRPPTTADAAFWASLRPDGTVEIASPRAEMGQGIATALRRIAAEETGVGFARVSFVHPRTDRMPPSRATVGSDSIADFAPLLAKACAALALAARRRAAAALGVPVGEIRILGDAALAEDGRAVPLADLARAPLVLDAEAVDGATARSLDPTSARSVIGTAQEPDGIRALITGARPLFADDVRLAHMVFGAVLRPPRLGARLEWVDDGAARDLAGYIGLRRDGAFAGILARTQGTLERALALVETRWSGGTRASQPEIDAAVDIDRDHPDGGSEHGLRDDPVDDEAPFDVALRLEVPMAAHAAMEPRSAVARLLDGRLEVWTGSQDVTFVRRVLADALDLDEARVVVHGQRLGGGFGGRTICTVELEAARLARASGLPVKVRWSREDEFGHAFHRPPSTHRIEARLTPEGRIAAWRHRFRSGHVVFTSAAMGPLLQRATSFVADPGVARGAVPPYAIGALHVGFEDVRLPVDTGPWRGLGAAPNVWAVETAIDALARAAGQDTLAFRLANLGPDAARLARCLARVATLSRWSERRATPELGYGVACGVYKEKSFAAVVAEVRLEGVRPRVTHLWCAHDCGLVIDPDGVRAQIEGNLVWGIGTALHERLELADGRVAAGNFTDYAIARSTDVPSMTIDLVDEGDPPSGAGETAIVAAPAAITNAIAAITGRTVTRLPHDPSRG